MNPTYKEIAEWLREAAEDAAHQGNSYKYNYYEDRAAQVEAMGWQPIETVLKDGGRIILCASITEGKIRWVRSGCWSDRWGRFFDGVEPSGFNNLTHWMPLPSPPEEQ